MRDCTLKMEARHISKALDEVPCHPDNVEPPLLKAPNVSARAPPKVGIICLSVSDHDDHDSQSIAYVSAASMSTSTRKQPAVHESTGK